jgi:type I restriction enzyme S subunit
MLDISPEQHALITVLLRREVPGIAVYCFGSRTQGRARPASDLDLILQADGPLDPARLEAVKDAFADSDLPFSVDILDYHTLAPRFRETIAGECVPFPDGPASDR